MSDSPPSVLGLTLSAGRIRRDKRAYHNLPQQNRVCPGLCGDPVAYDLWHLSRISCQVRMQKALAAAGEAHAGETPDLTPETVNAALDEVRPYLIADGGNVEVASVEEGVVFLRLQVSHHHPRLSGRWLAYCCPDALSAPNLSMSLGCMLPASVNSSTDQLCILRDSDAASRVHHASP